MADDDRASNPGTEPFVPDFEEDTGTQSFVPNFDDTGSQPVPLVAEPQKPAEGTPESKPETPAPAAASEEDAETDVGTEAGGAVRKYAAIALSKSAPATVIRLKSAALRA